MAEYMATLDSEHTELRCAVLDTEQEVEGLEDQKASDAVPGSRIE